MNNGHSLEKTAADPGLGTAQCSGDERSELERNGAAPNPAVHPTGVVPDPEVCEHPKRRRFTAAYKASVVKKADTCQENGAIGALLRQEGLYASQLANWRRQYRLGALTALKDNKRGRRQTSNPLTEEVDRLQRENACLVHRLEQAETIIEIQKKISTLLGIPLKDKQIKGND